MKIVGRGTKDALGKKVPVAQVDEMNALGAKHGFQRSGFRPSEKAVEEAAIEQIYRNTFRK